MTDDDADGVRCCVAAPPRLQHDADDQSISVALSLSGRKLNIFVLSAVNVGKLN